MNIEGTSLTKKLKYFCEEFSNDFTLDDRELLTRDRIDFLEVFTPIMVMFGYAKYLSTGSWLYLMAIGMRALFDVLMTPFQFLKRKRSSQPDEGGILILCNTYLAFRELYVPLLLSDKRNISVLFTSKKLEKKCSDFANSVGISIKTVAHGSVLKNLFHLCSDSISLMAHALKLESNDFQQYKRKIFLIYYAVFTSFQFLSYISAFKHSVQSSKYLALVTDDATDICVRYIVELVKLKQVLTNILQFGHYDIDSVGWKYVNSKKIYVWGSFYKDLIQKKFERSDPDIQIIGSPRFDYLFKEPPAVEVNDGSSKTLLVLSACSIKNYESISQMSTVIDIKRDLVRLLNEGIKECNVKIVVKPHPYESDAEIQIWRGLSNKQYDLLPKGGDVRDLIPNVDLVISLGSGLTLDSLVAGVPVIIPCWIPNYPWETGELIKAGAMEVTTINTFTKKLRAVILDKLDQEATMTEAPIRNYIDQHEPVAKKLMHIFLNTCQ